MKENWFKGEEVPVHKQKTEIRSAEDERAFRLLEALNVVVYPKATVL